MSYPTKLALMAGAIFLSTSVSFLSAMDSKPEQTGTEVQPGTEEQADGEEQADVDPKKRLLPRKGVEGELDQLLRAFEEYEDSFKALEKTVNSSKWVNASDLATITEQFSSLILRIQALEGADLKNSNAERIEELGTSLDVVRENLSSFETANTSNLQVLTKQITSLNYKIHALECIDSTRINTTLKKTHDSLSGSPDSSEEKVEESKEVIYLTKEMAELEYVGIYRKIHELSGKLDTLAELVKDDRDMQTCYNTSLTAILDNHRLALKSLQSPGALTCLKNTLPSLVIASGIAYSPVAREYAYNCAMAFLAHLNNVGIPLNDGPSIWAALSANLPAWVVQDMYLTTAVCALLYLTCKDILKKSAKPKRVHFGS